MQERRYCSILKTPSTPGFEKANIPLTSVNVPPFTPLYPMPFVPTSVWKNFVGDGCALIYRTYDGYNIHVSELEVHINEPETMSISIPLESFLHDLHLVYQLLGTTRLPCLSLPQQHHTQLYAPPTKGTMVIRADPDSHRYVACSVVAKGKWLARDIEDPKNPLFGLIQCLKARQPAHGFLAPTLTTADVLSWIDLLLTSPKFVRLHMDNALGKPLANLFDLHLAECGKQQQRDAADQQHNALVNGARIMVIELLARTNDGKLPELAYIAGKLGSTPDEIRTLHYVIKNQKFSHYVVECRIEEARNRLRRGDSIASVTFSLGWTDEPHFVNQFKHHVGITPGDFVKTK